MKQGKTACSGMRIRMDRLDGVVLDHLSERLLEPKRLQELLGGYLDQARDGQARAKEKLRQAREARGGVEAKARDRAADASDRYQPVAFEAGRRTAGSGSERRRQTRTSPPILKCARATQPWRRHCSPVPRASYETRHPSEAISCSVRAARISTTPQ
jgi:hypothetical protein